MGAEVPPECFRPFFVCLSVRLRNTLAPGAATLLLPPPRSYDLRCESLASTTFRHEIAKLFRDVPNLAPEDLAAFAKNRTRAAALHYLETAHSANYAPAGSHAILLSATELTLVSGGVCSIATLLGRLWGELSRAMFDVPTAIQKLEGGVDFGYFWHLALHWLDIAASEWPVLQLLEFFSQELRLRRRAKGSTPPADPAADALHAAVALRGRHEWDAFAAGAWAAPRTPFSMASAHLAQVLGMLDNDAPDEMDDQRLLHSLTAALLWLRSARRRRGVSPLMQVLLSEWPVLALWGRLWRHPAAWQRLVDGKARCLVHLDPALGLRANTAEALAERFLPSRKWPVILEPPPPPLSVMGPAALEVRPAHRSAQAPIGHRPISSNKEAWGSALSLASGSLAGLAWLDALRVLHFSLRRHEPPDKRRPFVLLVDHIFPGEHAATLRADGIDVRRVAPVHLPETIAGCQPKMREAAGLYLRFFDMVEFDRVLYIDADALVVGPLHHLFRVPRGVFVSATINGTRWNWPPGLPLQEAWDPEPGGELSDWGAWGGLQRGPPMLNIGILLIAPSKTLLEAIVQVASANETECCQGGWATCDPGKQLSAVARTVCGSTGIFTGYCSQGLLDAAFIAMGRRLGDVQFAEGPDGEGEFLGCSSPLGKGGRRVPVAPDRPGDHCTLDESYNLQVTRPHFEWHMPHLRSVARRRDRVRFVHWPGKPKPWVVGLGQETVWERLWWSTHADMCRSTAATGSAPCRLRCV